MNSVGKNIIIHFFGESHGDYIGVTIDQIIPGIKIDHKLIQSYLRRRRPISDINTSRVEEDSYEIISGIKEGITTGAPLTVLIKNQNHLKNEYLNLNITPRPSHSDLPAYIKFKGYNDYHGGGMFSGRLTALWMIVGAISEQILVNKNIYVGSHIYQACEIYDDPFETTKITKELLYSIKNNPIPLINHEVKDQLLKLIKQTKEEHDSLGGVIESAAINLPIGLGNPLFHSVESYLSYLLFSIPSVKGVEFGDGFHFAKMKGSTSNDEYQYENSQIKTKSNHNGGVVGGMTNGQPLIVRTVFKPISSIGKQQNTINLENKTNTMIKIDGRHDVQILTRVPVIVDSVINFAILDLLMENGSL